MCGTKHGTSHRLVSLSPEGGALSKGIQIYISANQHVHSHSIFNLMIMN